MRELISAVEKIAEVLHRREDPSEYWDRQKELDSVGRSAQAAELAADAARRASRYTFWTAIGTLATAAIALFTMALAVFGVIGAK